MPPPLKASHHIFQFPSEELALMFWGRSPKSSLPLSQGVADTLLAFSQEGEQLPSEKQRNQEWGEFLAQLTGGLGLAGWVCMLVLRGMAKSLLLLHSLKPAACAFQLRQSFSIHLFSSLPFQEEEQKDEILLKTKSEILMDLLFLFLQTSNCLCKV